jgi:D-alanyl-lipoteichoic acid acyltransferase DltB (MBOAT superfamily)
MSFVSLGFLLFLLILFILYYALPRRFQWVLLLAGSLVFYAFASPKYLIYIAVTALSTWFAGKLIHDAYAARDAYIKGTPDITKEDKKACKEQAKKKARRLMVCCLILNLGILAVCKYTDFAIGTINSLFKTDIAFLRFALPMGISFYTFQSMGYIIDVSRGKYQAELNPAKFALFVTFFPQLVQGPISRFDQLSQTLYSEHEFEAQKITQGAWRAMWGFFKKMVVADRLVPVVTGIAQNPDKYAGGYVLALVFFYTIQLYADFTGGIDITIGVAKMFGVDLAENFDRPFFSRNITEFWRRWHITMGTWFKDYIFYPVSVSKWMLKVSKWSRAKLGPQLGKRVPVYLSTILVWLATGIWHGASWNFVVWGLLNCLVIIISQELEPLYAKFHEKCAFSNTKGWDVFQMFRTFWLMAFLRVLDVYRNVPLTFRMVPTIFSSKGWSEMFSGGMLKLGLEVRDYIIVAVAIVIFLIVGILQGKKPVAEQLAEKPLVPRYLIVWVLIIVILVFGAYGIGFDATQFIYNQF